MNWRLLSIFFSKIHRAFKFSQFLRPYKVMIYDNAQMTLKSFKTNRAQSNFAVIFQKLGHRRRYCFLIFVFKHFWGNGSRTENS